MNLTIKMLIYVHAFLGGLGLLTGIISVWAKKGNATHKKAGVAFSYAMVASALISLFVARMAGHENSFLFLIGVFTLYMVLAGKRALNLKSKVKLKPNMMDYSLSGMMFLISVVMIIIGSIGIYQKTDMSMLYIFFGGFGVLLTLNDFKTFNTFTKDKSVRLRSHSGRMIGALIAATTAFMVTGLSVGTVLIWILPTIIGTAYILYWSRKLKKAESTI